MRQGTESETRPPFTEQPKHLNLTHGNYTNGWLCLVLGDNLRFFSLGRSWRRLLFFALLLYRTYPFLSRTESRSQLLYFCFELHQLLFQPLNLLSLF